MIKRTLLRIALLTISAGSGYADVYTYSYTGSLFDEFTTNGQMGPAFSLGAPNITAVASFSAPLGAYTYLDVFNGSSVDADSLLSWSLGTGVTGDAELQLSTDGNGDISGWYMTNYPPTTGDNVLLFESFPWYDAIFSGTDENGSQSTVNSDSLGAWTETDTLGTTTTPEPGAGFWMKCSGLLMIAGIVKMRIDKRSKQSGSNVAL